MTRPSPPDQDLQPQVALLSVEAAKEQAWNEQQLAAPVSVPAARLWRYPQPALVLGRSQHALLAALDAGSGCVVPRSAGGGAVLVGPWLLGASVVLPLHHRLLQVGSIADSYRWLADVFVSALAEHGVASAAVPRERARKPAADLAWACFAGTSAWEVAVDDRKLVGFAQRRGRHGVLLVAGVLIGSVPWPRLCNAMRRPVAQAQELAATTVDAAQLLGRPLPAEALAASLQSRLALALAA